MKSLQFTEPISATIEGFKILKKKNFKYKIWEKSLFPDKKIRKFLVRVNYEIAKKVLDGAEVRLPYRLGILRIEKKKMKNFQKGRLHVDFAHFKKTGKVIYHLNENRDGYYYRIKWYKGHVSGLQAYKFFPTRPFKRGIAQRLKDNNIDYREY